MPPSVQHAVARHSRPPCAGRKQSTQVLTTLLGRSVWAAMRVMEMLEVLDARMTLAGMICSDRHQQSISSSTVTQAEAALQRLPDPGS